MVPVIVETDVHGTRVLRSRLQLRELPSPGPEFPDRGPDDSGTGLGARIADPDSGVSGPQLASSNPSQRQLYAKGPV